MLTTMPPLQEIGHKEARAFDFKNRANSRDQSIQKHARPASQGGAGLLQPNPKEETSIAKIRSDLTHAEATAKEKLALSERGVKLVRRTCQIWSRLRHRLFIVCDKGG